MIWHNPALNPPPPTDDVLVAVRGEPLAAEAFYIDGEWTYSTGHRIDADRVYAWTELPACPAIRDQGPGTKDQSQEYANTSASFCFGGES